MTNYLPHERVEREQRECRMTLGDTLSTGGKYMSGAAEAVTNVAGNVAGWFASRGADLLVNVPKKFADGIIDAWNRDKDTSEVEKNEKLRAMSEFSRTTPAVVQELITKCFDRDKPTLTDLNRLMNQENWINMFQTPQNFDDAVVPKTADATLLNGPEGIFFALDTKGRKELYFQFVSAVIEPEVIKNPDFAAFFGPSRRFTGETTSVSERTDTMLAQAPTLNQAMKITLGIGEEGAGVYRGTAAFDIARQSLMYHYWRNPERPVVDGEEARVGQPPEFDPTRSKLTVGDPRGVSPEFERDVERATRGKALIPNLDAIRNGIGEPSRLRGALDPSLGIFRETDIQDVQTLMSMRAVERQVGLQKSVVERRQYSDSLKNEKQRSAETLGQTFMNMGGLEKAALVFLAIQALRSKGVRDIATGLGVLYFGQKFLLKQKDPINEIWAPTIRGITRTVADNPYVAGAFKKLNIKFEDKKYTDSEIQTRVQVAERFTSEKLRRRMDASAAGFSLLGDMELSDLANYVAITSNGSHAALQFWDPNFRRTIGEKLSRHGDKKSAAVDFFSGAEGFDVALQNPNAPKELGTQNVNEHMLDAGNSLASVYYMIAAKRPEFKDMMRVVEHFRGMSVNGRYTDLPYGKYEFDYNKDGRPDTVDPRAMYVHMVRAGMMFATGEHMTLFEFMENELRSNDNPYPKTRAIPLALGGPAPAPGTPPDAPDKPKRSGPTDDPPKTGGPTDDPTKRGDTTDDPSRRGDTPDDPTKRGDSPDDPARRGDTPDDPTRRGGSPDDPARRADSPDDPTRRGGSPDDPARRGAPPDDPARRGSPPDDPARRGSPADDPAARGGAPDDPSRRGSPADDPSRRGALPDDPARRSGAPDSAVRPSGATDTPSSRSDSDDSAPRTRDSAEDPSRRSGAADSSRSPKGPDAAPGRTSDSTDSSRSPIGPDAAPGRTSDATDSTKSSSGTADRPSVAPSATDDRRASASSSDAPSSTSGPDARPGARSDTPDTRKGSSASDASPKGRPSPSESPAGTSSGPDTGARGTPDSTDAPRRAPTDTDDGAGRKRSGPTEK